VIPAVQAKDSKRILERIYWMTIISVRPDCEGNTTYSTALHTFIYATKKVRPPSPLPVRRSAIRSRSNDDRNPNAER
jgi:hypothetical protein